MIEDLNKIETSATRDQVSIITSSCQACGDKIGLGKVLSIHISKMQIMAVYQFGMMQFNADGEALEYKKFN